MTNVLKEQTDSNFEIVEADSSNIELSSDGEELGTIEPVENFAPKETEWSFEIKNEFLNLPTIGSYVFDTPESVCGDDDRTKISNTLVAPWKYICKMIIVASNGGRYIGSGFFIGPRCIITSGHVVHDGTTGWARSIEVIPGLNGRMAPFGSVTSSKFISVKGWTRKKDPNYDHGAVILPDDTLYNRVNGCFGYREEPGLPILNNSGYPGDKRPSTHQWFNAGIATNNTGFRFEYMLDTAGGQSGSPTWINQEGKKYVVGVHGYGGCPNKCIRAQGYVLQKWGAWKKL